MKNNSGLTLTQVVAAAAIMVIVFVIVIAGFRKTSRSTYRSKDLLLATSLAKEKIQILRQLPYYSLFVTTSTAYNSDFSPAIPYDTSFFPPETVSIDGINFQRLTYIQSAGISSNGRISYTGSAPDMGVKSINTTVIWRQDGRNKKLQLNSVVSNPNTVVQNAFLSGTVKNSSTQQPVPGAEVSVVQNQGWSGVSSSTGVYSINFYPGSYNVVARAEGYFDSFGQISVSGWQYAALNFFMVPKATSTITGTARINTNPLISQVEVSSFQAGGYISGVVKDGYGRAIAPAIVVSVDGNKTAANPETGAYVMQVSSGFHTVAVNQGSANLEFVSQTRQSVPVYPGQNTADVNFYLSRGGQLSGRVTTDGTNPLPGVTVIATDSNNNQAAVSVSQTNGKFLLADLPSGSYSVSPALSSIQTSSPTYITGNVTIGANVSVGAFTVLGSYGRITGQVTDSGSAITTGVLVIASTNTLTSMPVISSASVTGAALYTANSLQNGTYSIDVRGSTTTKYNVYAFYPSVNGSSVSVKNGSAKNISVNINQTVSGINFSW